MATNRTFTMIKPDGVENGHTGAILDKINTAGFRIVAMKKTQMTKSDAIAIAVASRASNIKPARVLTIEEQGLQSVGKMRDLLDKQKLQLSNQVRGLLMEFGIIINKSIKNFKARIPDILEDAENQLPMPMRHSISKMWELYSRLEDDFKALNNELIRLTGQDDDCKRFMKLEGVGPITSMRLKIQLGSGEHFKSGRQVSACIGVTPK